MTVELKNVPGQAAGCHQFPDTLIFKNSYQNYYVGHLIKSLKNTATYKTSFYEIIVNFKGYTAEPSFATQIANGSKLKCDKYNRWYCWTSENPEEDVISLVAEKEAIRAAAKAKEDAIEAKRAAQIKDAHDSLIHLWDNAIASWYDDAGFEYRVLEIKARRVETVIISLGKEEDSAWSSNRWVSAITFREKKSTSFSSISSIYGDTREEALSEALFSIKSCTE